MSNEFRTPGWLKVGFAIQTVVICVCLFLFVQTSRNGNLVSQPVLDAPPMQPQQEKTAVPVMSDAAETVHSEPLSSDDRSESPIFIDEPFDAGRAKIPLESVAFEPPPAATEPKHSIELEDRIEDSRPAASPIDPGYHGTPAHVDAEPFPAVGLDASEANPPGLGNIAVTQPIEQDRGFEPPPPASPIRRLYDVRVGSPTEVAATIRDLFADSAKVSADSASRSVIVIAQEETHRQVAELIDEINERSTAIEKELQLAVQIRQEEIRKQEAKQRDAAVTSESGGGRRGAEDDSNENRQGQSSEPDIEQKLREELLSNQQELAQMKRHLGNEHPKVRAAEGVIQSTRELLADYRAGRFRIWKLSIEPGQDPHRVLKVLSDLFGDQLRSSLDEEGDTISIRMSSPKSTAEAQELFEQVSNEMKKAGVAISESKVARRFPSDESDAALDGKAKELAQRLRTAESSDRLELLNQLRRLTLEQFQQRQERRRAEFDSLTQRVERLKDSYRRRQEHQAEIIERRINDLLDPNADLQWESSDGKISTESVQSDPANPSEHPVRVSSQKDEPQYDGLTYRQWLKILENETKVTRLQEAVVAMGHLLNSAEPRELSRTVLQMVRRLDDVRSADWGHVFSIVSEVFNLFARLPRPVVVESLIAEIPEIASHTSTRDFFNRYLELIAYPNGRYGRDEMAGMGGVAQVSSQTRKMLPELKSEIAVQSQRFVTEFIRVADRTGDLTLKSAMVANASCILTISKRTLGSYPDLVPSVNEVFDLSEKTIPVGKYTPRLWAATLLAGNNLRMDDVLQLAEKLTSDEKLSTHIQFAEAVRVYVAAAPNSAAVVDRLETMLSMRWNKILSKAKSPSADPSDLANWDQCFCLIRALSDIGAPAVGSVQLLESISESPAANILDSSIFGGELSEPIQAGSATMKLRAKNAARKIIEADKAAKSGATQVQPKSESAAIATASDRSTKLETTYDGITYSQWLKLLETERKPEKLIAAIQTCARLVEKGDERKVAHLIFLAEGFFEGDRWADERSQAANVGHRALSELPGDIVVDELLIALRDRESYQKGRSFQTGFLSRPEPDSIPHQEIVVQRANEVIAALLNLVPEIPQEEHYYLIGAAISVWRKSERPLSDFDGLPERAKQMATLGFSKTSAPAYYHWWNAMSHLAIAAPETPDLAINLLKQAQQHAQSSGRIVSALKGMKRHAAPAVDGLVELFESESKRFFPNPTVPLGVIGGFPARTEFPPESSEFLQLEIIAALGEIGTGDAGFELLAALKDLAASDDLADNNSPRGRGGAGRGGMGRTVVFIDLLANAAIQAIGKFPPDYAPSTDAKLVSDFWKLNGTWQMTSASFDTPVQDARVKIRLNELILISNRGADAREPQQSSSFPLNLMHLLNFRGGRLKLSIDQSKSPKRMDFMSKMPRVVYESMNPRPEGITIRSEDTVTFGFRGIYDLKDDTLVIQISKTGQPGPEKISGGDEEIPTDQVRLEFKRIPATK